VGVNRGRVGQPGGWVLVRRVRRERKERQKNHSLEACATDRNFLG
jgi:hypothetical protein